MARMKGLPHKVGEHLAMKRDSGWDEYRDLVVGGCPVPSAPLLERVQAELGTRFSALSTLDATPLGAGSLAQVFGGRLAAEWGGGEVAVKVFYPDIARALSADLQGLARSVSGLAALLPAETQGGAAYLALCLETLRPNLLAEIDGEAEARHLAKFAEFFEGVEGIAVPRPISALCTANVVVMDFVRGEKLVSVLDRVSDERARRAVCALVRAWFRMAGELGALHADLHPGNVLATGPEGQEETRLSLIDLGQVTRLDTEMWRSISELGRAARSDDAASAQRCLNDLGFEVKPHAPRQADGSGAGYLGVAQLLCAPFLVDAEYDLRDWRIQEKLDALEVTLLAPPRHVMAMRSLFGLTYYVKRYRVGINWFRLLDEFGHKA
jgi:tRNA A-37 threonylcarbamoyl transferase component Bud32